MAKGKNQLKMTITANTPESIDRLLAVLGSILTEEERKQFCTKLEKEIKRLRKEK